MGFAGFCVWVLSGFLAFLSAVFIGQVVWEVQLAPPPRWIVPISKIEQGILGGKRGASSDTEARLKKESPLKTVCKIRLLRHPGGRKARNHQSHGWCGRGVSRGSLTEKFCHRSQPHGASAMGRTSASSVLGSALQERLRGKQASRGHPTPVRIPPRVWRSPAGFSLPSSSSPSPLHVVPPALFPFPEICGVERRWEQSREADETEPRGMVCRDADPLVCSKKRGEVRARRARPGSSILLCPPEGEVCAWGKLVGAGRCWGG